MEKMFNQTDLVTNPFQDPMGNDTHRGLERFLDKFHQPGIPAYTLSTDPDYYVFLWFHNANGNLISCPYIHPDGYKNFLFPNWDFFHANKDFASYWGGIHGGAYQDGKTAVVERQMNLDPKCVDLTPFVREATLPEIAPANAERIKTLFGETSAGSFSPYASDGSKTISL